MGKEIYIMVVFVNGQKTPVGDHATAGDALKAAQVKLTTGQYVTVNGEAAGTDYQLTAGDQIKVVSKSN